MRRIKIVADTSCDLLELKHTEFATAPMKIITNVKEFVDNKSLDVNEMVDFMDRYKGESKSSCPNTNDWINAFGDADDIFCVTITSGLSGSYNSACVAKEVYETENKGKRVFVIDTLSAGPEITLVIKKLEEYIENKMSYEEICDKITAYIKKTGLLFMLKSLKTFANNGRVSPVVARLVGIAGICIVGKASNEGTLEPMHKCRGEKRSLETLLNDLETEGFKSGKISIGHCQNEAAALRLKEMILAKFKNASIEIHKLRGLCSFYAEKGGVLVGFEKA
ncbi:MAG: DegV family EDD domain-containing protein [Ruminococcaceae bacterium]|nr:DegV family EDD domain-containing protein [Oscillospiraceae bacterium]